MPGPPQATREAAVEAGCWSERSPSSIMRLQDQSRHSSTDHRAITPGRPDGVKRRSVRPPSQYGGLVHETGQLSRNGGRYPTWLTQMAARAWPANGLADEFARSLRDCLA